MDQVKYSFSAGEFSRELYGRTDLELYDLGAKSMSNVVVNYGGGAFKRRGTVFTEFLQYPESPIRGFSFRFSRDLANTYVVLFGDGYVRFMQDGAYVLDDAQTVTSIVDGTVVATAHGYSTGDLVYVEGLVQIAVVTKVDDDTFLLRSIIDGTGIDFDAGAVEVQGVFTLDSPYDPDDLAELTYSQYLDEVLLTHADYPVYVLTRTSTTWTLEEQDRDAGRPLNQTPTITDSGAYIQDIHVLTGSAAHGPDTVLDVTDSTGTGFKGKWIIKDGSFANDILGVTIIKPGRNYTSPSLAVSGDGTYTFDIVLADTIAGYLVAVSAIYEDGTESGITRPAIIRDSIDFTQTRGSSTYTWTAVAGAVKYNIYRSIIVPNGADMHLGYALGYIGTARGTKFTDNNITPDFTRTPKVYRDPFAAGAVAWIDVTGGGSSYDDANTLSLSGGSGTGFKGYPIVQGETIIGVYIANPGSGYSDPATLTDSGTGSGATYTVHLTEDSGTYPSTAFRFQRRYGYAGTKNQPMTVWASVPDELSFGEREYPVADDPYEYTIDSKEVTPIRHAVPMQQGLLLFTPSSVALLRGADGSAVTPKNGFLDPQSAVGCAPVPPELVGDDIIYVQDKYRGVQMMVAEPTSKKYIGQEISILSRHLFDGRAITSLGFAYTTEKMGFGVFDDGTAFSLTLDRDQKINGFARASMQGYFRDVISVDVGNEEHLYFQEEITIDGNQTKIMAIMLPEESEDPEDAIYLDACISTAKVHPAAQITLSGTSGVVTVTASAEVFTSDDVSKVLWACGGRGFVTGYSSPTSITVTLTRPVSHFIPESSAPEACEEGEWWMNPLVMEVGDLPWEGRTVSIVADGSVLPDQVVVDGAITLPRASAIVHVGFSYRMELETLSPAGGQESSEGRNISMNEVFAKFKRTGSFNVGPYEYEAFFRTDEAYAEPTRLNDKSKKMNVSSGWAPDGTMIFSQENGLPFEMTQLVVSYSVGS